MTRVGDNPPALPKRFYKAAIVEAGEGFRTILLDGKPAKTRARHPLGATSPSLAAAIADEWNAQAAVIDGATMPMTRFQSTAIDRGAIDADDWRVATLAFLLSDLLCYRAEAPPELAARQAAAWEPLLAWAATAGIALKSGPGVGFLVQSPAALGAGGQMLRNASAASLLGIKCATEISGSAVIGLALWRGAFPAEILFDASRIDEMFQAEKWGADAEAEARAQRLRRDFLDAARYLSLSAAAG